jgi:hypothetical protein
LNIGSVGTPTTVSAPTASMFQVSSIAMRLLVDLAFAKRRADGVQYIDAIAWT